MSPDKPNFQGTDSVSDSAKSDKAPVKIPLYRRTIFKVGVPVVLGLAALGGYEAAVNGIIDVPGIHQSVDIAPIFNNELTSQYIKAGVNAVPVTETDMASAGEVISPSDKQGLSTVKIVFPGLLQPGDQVKIDQAPLNVTFAGSPDIITLKCWYNFTFANSGKELYSGVIDNDAKTIEVFKKPYIVKGGVSYFNGIIIRVTRNDGTTYEIGCSSPKDIRNLKALPILDDAPTIELETVHVGDHDEVRTKNANQPGKLVSKRTPLVVTTSPNTTVEYGYSDSNITTTKEILVFDKTSLITDANGQLEYPIQP